MKKLAFLAAAAAAFAAWRRRSGAESPAPAAAPAPGPGPDTPAADVVEQSWTCDCGQEYRYSGDARHRVFWPAESDVSDPVLDGKCRKCETTLPTEPQEATT